VPVILMYRLAALLVNRAGRSLVVTRLLANESSRPKLLQRLVDLRARVHS
jgi:hypothetical protein